MDLLEKYLGESKMGKLPGKVVRTVWGGDPFTMTWELINTNVEDRKVNYKSIEDLAWKELKSLKSKNIVDFYEQDFNINMIDNMRGEVVYQAEVKLRNYDHDKLMKELRRLKFKVKR